MSEKPDLESTSLTHRVVLLSVAELCGGEGEPAHGGDIVSCCTGHLTDLEGEVFGKLSEADVARALNELEHWGFVDRASVGDTSAVGKGRPAYVLGIDTEHLLAEFDADGRVAHLVAYVRDVSA